MEKELEKKLIKKILLSPIMIGVFIFILAISVGTAYGAANYLYDSKDVKYDNTESGIVATNVQGAVDELYAAATDYSGINTRVTTLETQIYPVGSIYISVNNTNPSTIFGGTWESFGEGRTLIGVDTTQGEFDTIEETGGAKTHSIGVSNLPVHNHSIPSLSGSTNTTGAHQHGVYYNGNVTPGGTHWSVSSYIGSSTTQLTTSAGNHSHTVTTTASNTNGCTNCSGTALNTQDPYITVYMWKRTA